MNIHIHVGSNIPGYLPENKPGCFDNIDDAIEYLRHELRDQADHYAQQCDVYFKADYELWESCECEWCSVSTDVEAALSAIADGDAKYRLLKEGGWDTLPTWGAIFSPPEGPDVHHWITVMGAFRDGCEIAQEQGE